jgi:hypothetical protein
MAEPMQVLAASFNICNDDACQCPETMHLLVSTNYVPLETGNAVAISYTWGEFDRHEMLLGHDENGRNVSMVLGCEWNRIDVIERLFQLAFTLTSTEEAMPFWIDQLCIPQDNEAVIRATLAAIPKIFNIFDSVALLPGSPCKCLQKSINIYGQHQFKNLSRADATQLSIEWAQMMGMCVNSISFCSYFERVWTRQEMEYTRKMHVEWTGSEVSPCVRPSAHEGDIMFKLLNMRVKDVDDEDEGKDEDENTSEAETDALEAEQKLAPFARQVYQRALASGMTHIHALARVKLKHDKAWHNCLLAFEDFLSRDVARTHGRYFAIEALCQFLTGTPLEIINKDSAGVVLTEAQKLRKFASQLSGVGWVQRSATRERDYVLAVWIDCPRYTVPDGYATMGLPLLLEDAIMQLERNFKMTVPVLAFAGLFGGLRPSVFWRPTMYLPKVEVSHTRHVYGPILPESAFLPISESPGLPLNVYRPEMGRAKNHVLFTDFIYRKSAEQIIHFVRSVVAEWPNATVERIQSSRKTEFENPLEGLSAGVKNMLLMAHPLMKELLAETVPQFTTIEAMIFHSGVVMIHNEVERFLDVLFELVCEALGLFIPAQPFRYSLPLVIRDGENPAIGICRQEWPGQRNSSSRAEGRVTVCRDDSGPGSGNTVLEAVKIESEVEFFDTYMAIGVWVPQQVTSWQDIGGVTIEATQNALLI